MFAFCWALLYFSNFSPVIYSLPDSTASPLLSVLMRPSFLLHQVIHYVYAECHWKAAAAVRYNSRIWLLCDKACSQKERTSAQWTSPLPLCGSKWNETRTVGEGFWRRFQHSGVKTKAVSCPFLFLYTRMLYSTWWTDCVFFVVC